MLLTLLKCKLHRATVTDCDLDYEGSISIDADLIEAAGMIPFEQVDVLNINNGERLTTYVIAGARGSGVIGLNGAAARKAMRGDRVIIVAYCQLPAAEARQHKPVVVLVDDANRVAGVH
jgi:aspartate 1-decarboxylase